MALNEAQELFSFFFAIYFYMIIDRSHVVYRSWDTYAAWRGSTHDINRLVAAWFVLILLPVTHFAVLFTLIGLFNVTFDPTPLGVIHVILISLGAFFTFGYYRLYESLIHGFPQSFFSDEDQKNGTTVLRPHIRAHMIPGLLYVILSTLLMMIVLII